MFSGDTEHGIVLNIAWSQEKKKEEEEEEAEEMLN